MVFQDSISAVNPRKTVREILREPNRRKPEKYGDKPYRNP